MRLKFWKVMIVAMSGIIIWTAFSDVGQTYCQEKYVFSIGNAFTVLLTLLSLVLIGFLLGRDSKDSAIVRRRIMSWSPSASPSAAPDDEENN